MTNVLVVVGSARKGRVANTALELVKNDIAAREGVESTVADLAEINLPFFDNEVIPAMPNYTPNNEAGKQWQALVAAADKVVLITPEYNHSYSPILKNALDYLAAEWKNKSVALVGYGWVGGERAMKALEPVFANLDIDAKPAVTKLVFTKELSPTGEIIDEAATTTQVKATIDELLS